MARNSTLEEDLVYTTEQAEKNIASYYFKGTEHCDYAIDPQGRISPGTVNIDKIRRLNKKAGVPENRVYYNITENSETGRYTIWLGNFILKGTHPEKVEVGYMDKNGRIGIKNLNHVIPDEKNRRIIEIRGMGTHLELIVSKEKTKT